MPEKKTWPTRLDFSRHNGQATEIVLKRRYGEITTMHKVRSTASMIGVLLAVILLSHQTTIAQQLSVPADSSETVALRRSVKDLEERLKKLEAAQVSNSGSVSLDKTTFPVGATPSPATNPAPPAQGDDKAKSTDQGLLNFFREVEVSHCSSLKSQVSTLNTSLQAFSSALSLET